MNTVAVIGSRSFNNFDLLKATLANLSIDSIISGGAKGADSLAKKYASDHSIPIQEILPEYKKYGRVAPIKRNESIVLLSNLVIAFWDGKSKGTKYSIDFAKKKNIPVTIILSN
jgi:hypothetical protein